MSDDLISRQAAIDAVRGRFSMPVDNLIVEVIGNLPSAERHGRWKPVQYGCVCSVCGKRKEQFRDNFCANCGSEMDEVSKDE